MTNHHLHRLPLSSPQLSALASPSSSPLGAGYSVRGSVSSAGNTPGSVSSSSSQSLTVGAPSQSTTGEGAFSPAPIKLSLASHRLVVLPSLFKNIFFYIFFLVSFQLFFFVCSKETLLINSPAGKSLQKQISYEPAVGTASPLQKTAAAAAATCLVPSQENQVTLDSIITEYLTNQHALCKNPMVTCPQFNLFE